VTSHDSLAVIFIVCGSGHPLIQFWWSVNGGGFQAGNCQTW